MFGRRFLFLILVLISAASHSSTPARQDSARLAAALIQRVVSTQDWHMGVRPDVEKELKTSQLDRLTLLQGCVLLLQIGTAEEKSKCASFLGRLGEQSTIEPLRELLTDKDSSVRASACYALLWLQAKDEPTQRKLSRLCRDDSSVEVRVAAAVALSGTDEVAVIAALNDGLKSRNRQLWRTCEDELHRLGKLELPLPMHIYTEISLTRYQEMKSDRWYWIQRETTQDNVIYLEIVERVKDVPLWRDWYRVPIERDQ